MLCLALVSGLLAADSVVLEQPTAAPEPTLVVDFTPMATMAPLLAGAPFQAVLVYVPVTVTWAVGPSTALHAELGVGYSVPQWGPSGGSVNASVGPLFSFGRSALQGFFICPKVGFQLSNASTPLGPQIVAQDAGNGPLDLGPSWSRAFLAGLDVGYQWTWSGRHIALMIGASAGYAYDNGGPLVDPFGLSRGRNGGIGRFPPPAQRDQGFAFAFNGNLFRVGFAL